MLRSNKIKITIWNKGHGKYDMLNLYPRSIGSVLAKVSYWSDMDTLGLYKYPGIIGSLSLYIYTHTFKCVLFLDYLGHKKTTKL